METAPPFRPQKFAKFMMLHCFLHCTSSTHDAIPLQHQHPVIIGRSLLTDITDKSLSRKQVELTADCHKKVVHVKQLGCNPCKVGHRLLASGDTAIATESTALFVLGNKYEHYFKFQMQHDSSSRFGNGTAQKRKAANNECRAKAKQQRFDDVNKKEDSDGSDSEHMEAVKMKLKLLKENMKKTPVGDTKKTPVGDTKKTPVGDMKKTPVGDMKKTPVGDMKKTPVGDMKKTPVGDMKKTPVGDMKKTPVGDMKKTPVGDMKKTPVGDMKKTPVGDTKSSPGSERQHTETTGEAAKDNGPQGTGRKGVVEGHPTKEAVWKQHDSLMLYTSSGVRGRSKIAAFDIDSTIIGTQSGKVFPTHSGDWRILYPEIPGKLKKLFLDGYKIVFLTNQRGLRGGKVKLDEYKEKVSRIVCKLGVPVQVFVSLRSGPYRKPAVGSWTHLCDQGNDGIEVDMKNSFYVGDAAGRPKDWAPRKKKDFSCSDRLFALNLNLPFYTPEEFFLGKKPAQYNMPEFDPRKLDMHAAPCNPADARLTPTTQPEVIVFVGFPASGKSFFYLEHLKKGGYVHVSRDSLGSWQKCVKACENALSQRRSVVIDNTNPEVESRKRYLDVASKFGVKCRCFIFTASHQHARHNERFREMTDSTHQAINEMIIHSYRSKYTEPQLSEGFTEIVKVKFVPRFHDKKLQSLYTMFLLDK